MHTRMDEHDEKVVWLLGHVSLHTLAGLLFAIAVLVTQSIVTACIAGICFTILMIVDIYYVLQMKKELKNNER